MRAHHHFISVANTGLIEEKKRPIPQVARVNRVTKFPKSIKYVKLSMLQRILNLRCGFPHVKHEKGEKVTTNKKQYADTDGLQLIHSCSTFCTYFNVQSLAVV